MRSMKRFWIGSWLLALSFALFAQAKSEQLRVVHADRLFFSQEQEERVMELSGKVHFWYGKTEFRSDRALIFDKRKIARLDGNVKVNNDSLTLMADSLSYYREREELNAGGRVHITEQRKDGGFSWLRADKAIYRKGEDKVTVWQNVSAYDDEEKASATCGYAFWDRGSGYAYMVENPFLSTAREDSLRIRANKIEFFDKEDKVVATFNVEAMARDYSTQSDFLLYFSKQDKAVFTGRPSFASDLATAEAREFYLYFKERQLLRAELVDSCRVYFTEERGQNKSNWVVADFIALDFREGDISAFHAERAVDYYYRQEQTEERDFLVNHAQGDVLDASFSADNKLESMTMRQGIKGTYKFRSQS